MCQCFSFLSYFDPSQRWPAWRASLLHIFMRIRLHQSVYFPELEGELLQATRLQHSSLTDRPGDLASHSFSSKAPRMGACVSSNSKSLPKGGRIHGKGNDPPSDSSKSLKWRKKEAKRGMEAAGAKGHLSQMPHRLCANGASNVASLFTQQGRKGVNQDAMLVWENFCSREDTIFCGVFDGHGPYGHLVAQSVRDMLPAKLVSNWQAMRSGAKEFAVTMDGNAEAIGDGKRPTPSLDNDDKQFREGDNKGKESEALSLWKASILHAYKVMDKELRIKPNVDCFCSGTTAVALVKQGNDVIIGNVGDSRAVLGTKSDNDSLMAVQLTIDLKPNLPQEAERIRQCKGRVFSLHDEPEVHRVWLPHDNSPGLAMARAFGDFCLKNFGLIAVPDITYHRLTERDQFIVLATDGIWDVLTNEQVVEIVSSVSARPLAARAVVDTAVRAWRSKYPTSKVDDCAVVCLYVNDISFVAREWKLKPNSLSKKNSLVVAEESKLVESPEIGNKAESSSIEGAPTDSQDDKNKISPVASAEPQEGAGLETQEDWSALEGVTRVNSLVNLPRFASGGKIEGA